MPVIRNKNGDIIQRSQNLRGIRAFVGKNIIKVLSIDAIGGEPCRETLREGKLCILFENGDSFETNFASLSVLKGWVARWRNAWGAPLRVDGHDCGTVSAKNPALAT